MNKPFRDQPFNARLGSMGDAAEAAFERWCDERGVGVVRFGLNRPPLRVGDLPPVIRYMPDYLTTAEFVECQGFGRDGLLKLKTEKRSALDHWNTLHSTALWAWDSRNKTGYRIPIPILHRAIDQDGRAVLGSFSDGKTYFQLDKSTLADVAEQVVRLS